MADPQAPLVLASASAVRRKLLDNAGLDYICDPAAIDEHEIKEALLKERATPMRVAETLAELKAQRVAVRHPGCIVIGADQVLDCEGVLYDKPTDIARARADLLALRGKVHALVTSVVVVRDGGRLWHHIDHSMLTMRWFGDDFLNRYLDQTSESVCESVGAYKIEARGAQLFEKIEGDYFSILGLPLLPLLDFLRNQGVVSS
jgi:septum formation protein